MREGRDDGLLGEGRPKKVEGGGRRKKLKGGREREERGPFIDGPGKEKGAHEAVTRGVRRREEA